MGFVNLDRKRLLMIKMNPLEIERSTFFLSNTTDRFLKERVNWTDTKLVKFQKSCLV